MAVRVAASVPKPLTKSFDELAAHLRMAEGAALLVVTTSDRELEDALVDALRDRLAEQFAILELTFTPQQLSLLDFLSTVRRPPGQAILLVRGLDDLAPEERRRVLQAMNLGREVLRLASLPIVLWLRPNTANELLVHAPDIWVVRSAAFTFELPPDEVVRAEALATLRLGAAKSLDDLRRRYLDWLTTAHRWVDFRGLLQVRNVLRVPLEDIFVESQLVRPQTTDDRPQPELLDRPDVMLFADHWRLAARVEQRMTLAEVLREHRCLVILGDPGSGKSTLLRHLALTAARGLTPLPQPEGVRGEDERLPILLPISAYAAARAKERELTLADYLPRYWIGRGMPDFGRLFTRELKRGRVLVLLDGLDEVLGPEDRAAVAREVQALAAQHPANRFVVTSRIAGYHSALLGGNFAEVTIAPFGPDEIERFAGRWSRAYEAAAGWTPESEQRATLRAHDLVEAVNSHPGIQRLATNPLLLTILALIHYQGTRLPHRRVELYRLSVQALAETWNRARSLSGRPIDLWLDREPLDERHVVRILAPIAFWMHEEVPGGLAERSVLETRLAQHFVENEGQTPEKAAALARDFLDLIREQSGLLVERGLDFYAFMHLTFQEYLAARYVAAQDDPFELLRPHLHDPRWREVVLLTAGILGDFSEANALARSATSY